MLKDKKWHNSNKMIVESEYGTFNKQTDVIATGTVYASTQYSKCVRPWGMKEWAGKGYESGELLKADMRSFHPIGNESILESVYDQQRKECVILYEFFVKKYDRRGGVEKDVLGHVLTDEHNRLISYSLYVPERNSVPKRRSALFEAMNYVVDGWAELSDAERLTWQKSLRKVG